MMSSSSELELESESESSESARLAPIVVGTIDLFLAIPHAFHRIEVSLLREKSPQYKKDSDPISPKVVHAARSSMKLYRRAGEKSHARTPTPASPPEEPEMPADLDADTGLMGVDPPVDHGPSPAPTAAPHFAHIPVPPPGRAAPPRGPLNCNEPADCIGQLGVGDLGLVPPSSSPVPTSPQMNPSFPIEGLPTVPMAKTRPSIVNRRVGTKTRKIGHEGPNPASSKLKSLLGMAQDAHIEEELLLVHIDYGACLNLRKFAEYVCHRTRIRDRRQFYRPVHVTPVKTGTVDSFNHNRQHECQISRGKYSHPMAFWPGFGLRDSQAEPKATPGQDFGLALALVPKPKRQGFLA
ncbi:hypothetical protein B0H14DRAFT_3719740 [Mycena olivaceomarginata]|nr:hypothetical protein B0H14DRAFT_3719740 [Mycena olivaceomarginata]